MLIVKRLDVEGDDSPPSPSRHLRRISSANHCQSLSVDCMGMPDSSRDDHVYHALYPSTMNIRPMNKVESFIDSSKHRTDEELAALSQSPDQASVHTEWRDQIYIQWNHVFFDVANWLHTQFPESAGIGHLHPPKSHVLELEFPSHTRTATITRKWDFDVLLVPAFVKPDVKLRLAISTHTSTDQPHTEYNGFDDWSKGDIYYVRRGTEIDLTIEQPAADLDVSLAVVMTIGELCSSEHIPEDEDEDEDESEKPVPREKTQEEIEEEELQMEVRSSVANVLAMAAMHQSQQGRSS